MRSPGEFLSGEFLKVKYTCRLSTEYLLELRQVLGPIESKLIVPKIYIIKEMQHFLKTLSTFTAQHCQSLLSIKDSNINISVTAGGQLVVTGGQC